MFQKLKTIGRRHIDQMIRTRNFKARNESVETGVLVKRQRGRKVSVERKVENVSNGEELDSVQEETLKVSVTKEHRETGANKKNKKAQSSSPAPKSWAQTDDRKPSQGPGPRGESPSGLKSWRACRNFLQVSGNDV